MTIYVICDNSLDLQLLVGGAKTLADKVTAVCFLNENDAKNVNINGADKVLYKEVKEGFSCEDYAKLISDEMKKEGSAYAFVANTIKGRAIAGKLSVYLDTAVLTNVSEIEKENDKLTSVRTIYGGTALRKSTFETPYGVFTFGSGAFEEKDGLDAPKVYEELSGEPSSKVKKIASVEKQENAVNLAVAKRIVDVGRGLAKEEDLSMIKDLAAKLGAEVGCSRPVAENLKWLPKAQYLGITGTQVKPDFLITCGVSGQVQHIGGINKSKVIISINKDKGAPIFKNCDFGLVGDMYKIIPMLISKL